MIETKMVFNVSSAERLRGAISFLHTLACCLSAFNEGSTLDLVELCDGVAEDLEAVLAEVKEGRASGKN